MNDKVKVCFKVINSKDLSPREIKISLLPLYNIYGYKTEQQCINYIIKKYGYHEKNRQGLVQKGGNQNTRNS